MHEQSRDQKEDRRCTRILDSPGTPDGTIDDEERDTMCDKKKYDDLARAANDLFKATMPVLQDIRRAFTDEARKHAADFGGRIPEQFYQLYNPFYVAKAVFNPSRTFNYFTSGAALFGNTLRSISTPVESVSAFYGDIPRQTNVLLNFTSRLDEQDRVFHGLRVAEDKYKDYKATAAAQFLFHGFLVIALSEQIAQKRREILPPGTMRDFLNANWRRQFWGAQKSATRRVLRPFVLAELAYILLASAGRSIESGETLRRKYSYNVPGNVPKYVDVQANWYLDLFRSIEKTSAAGRQKNPAYPSIFDLGRDMDEGKPEDRANRGTLTLAESHDAASGMASRPIKPELFAPNAADNFKIKISGPVKVFGTRSEGPSTEMLAE